MKFEISGQSLDKISEVECNQNPSGGSREKDRHDQAKIRFSQFGESAYRNVCGSVNYPKMVLVLIL
jgi:hypothetical protein